VKRFLSCLIAAALVACGARTNDQTKSAAAPARQTLPPGHPPIAPAASVAEAPVAPANAAKLTGKVLEAIDAGGYTYLDLRTDSGDVWAAVPQTAAVRGTVMTVLPQMTMEKFESKTLKRTFDRLIFAVVDGGQPAAASMPAAMASAGGQVGDVQVAKAEGAGGKTVAEVWAARVTLKDSPVTIRGKVVKFLPAIMGKNWLHLRDGSGARANGDDDITVTTGDSAAVGDVVLVRGTVRIDKDFGAGYRYAVIVEEANVSK